LLRIGVKPTERFSKALAYANEALEISEKIASPRRIVNALTVLTDVHEKNQDYVNAYTTYKKYIVLKDSLEGVDVVAEITRKETQYEFDKKETALKYEQQLTADQLEKQKLLTTQQQQTLTLNAQALLLANKEKEVVHLAFLKEAADCTTWRAKNCGFYRKRRNRKISPLSIIFPLKSPCLQTPIKLV
jgi:two-component system, NtrC family, sensor kinase